MLSYDLIPLSQMQLLSGRHLRESLAQSAPVTLHTDIEYDPEWDLRLSPDTPLFPARPTLLFAVVKALQEHPWMNAHVVGDQLVAYHEVNVGILVETGGGVVAPVIRNAGRHSVRELAAVALELTHRARSGVISLEDMRSATFTVADLGAYGVDSVDPVLPSDKVGVLGIGRIRHACLPDDGGCRSASVITLSLTFDHRATDSFRAALFLQSIQRQLKASTQSAG